MQTPGLWRREGAHGGTCFVAHGREALTNQLGILRPAHSRAAAFTAASCPPRYGLFARRKNSNWVPLSFFGEPAYRLVLICKARSDLACIPTQPQFLFKCLRAKKSEFLEVECCTDRRQRCSGRCTTQLNTSRHVLDGRAFLIARGTIK